MQELCIGNIFLGGKRKIYMYEYINRRLIGCGESSRQGNYEGSPHSGSHLKRVVLQLPGDKTFDVSHPVLLL